MAEKKADKAETEEQPAGGKKKLIIMIVAAILLVGIGVGGAVLFLGGSDSESAEADEQLEEEPLKGDPTYVELKPFTVNLDPEDSVAFLQVQIQVLTYFSEVAADLEKHKPLIRNNLTMLFGQQKSQDLRSQEGKALLQEKVRGEVQQVIDKYGSGGEVDNVFFTSFVMQ